MRLCLKIPCCLLIFILNNTSTPFSMFHSLLNTLRSPPCLPPTPPHPSGQMLLLSPACPLPAHLVHALPGTSVLPPQIPI